MKPSLVDLADILSALSNACRNDAKIKAIVLASASRGIRGLQTALGVHVDGIFGPITDKALDTIEIDVLIDSILRPLPPIMVQPPPPVIVPIPTSPPPKAPPPTSGRPTPPPTPYSNEYLADFTSMIINPDRMPEVIKIGDAIEQNVMRYSMVANAVGLPYWRLIGIIHNLESDMNFSTHLYNGDPLTARTTHNPVGRPGSGNPPFTWEFSATDALRYEGWDSWHDWSIAGMAYMLEKYNGFGYRRDHNVLSPYLWAGSNMYTKGFYTSDGNYDPNAISHQIGGMTMLKYFISQGKTP